MSEFEQEIIANLRRSKQVLKKCDGWQIRSEDMPRTENCWSVIRDYNKDDAVVMSGDLCSFFFSIKYAL